jgi:flagellar assembly protein FliH
VVVERSLSKNVIAHAEALEREDVSLWDLPIVSEGEATRFASKTEITLPTAEDIENIQQQAYKEAYDEAFEKAKQEGFEQGKAEGHKQGHEEGKAEGFSQGLKEGQIVIDEKSTHFESLISTLTAPLENLDNEVEEELVSLAMLVARHLIRRELKLDPSHVIAAIRQAVDVLPIATQNIILFLHPEDATLLRESLSMADKEEQRWKIVEDPMLSRGGCLVETEYSRIDASVESRLNSVITQVIGGERESDHAVDPSS